MTLESTMRPTEHPRGSDTLLPTNHLGNGSPGTSLSERSRAGATPLRSESTRGGGREAMSLDDCTEVNGRGKGDSRVHPSLSTGASRPTQLRGHTDGSAPCLLLNSMSPETYRAPDFTPSVLGDFLGTPALQTRLGSESESAFSQDSTASFKLGKHSN